MSFFNELKRRNVFRVSVAYIIISWLLAQVADLMLENFGAPGWVIKSFLGFLLIGFPLAIFFAWAFELTAEGVKRESNVDRSQSITVKTGNKLDRSIIVVLTIALAWFAWDRFGSTTELPQFTKQTETAEAVTPTGQIASAKSIAVLPFLAMSNGPDDEYFADGLTEEILNSLAQLPELLVTARTSAFHFKGQDIPVQEIASVLGVEHIVEGSVRKSGQRLRVTAQLIRAEDGFHIWSKNYDSTSQDTIAVQEDIAEQIASAMDVVMDDNKREAMRKAGLRDVEAFIAYQKGLDLFAKAHGDSKIINILGEANQYFETVLELVPGFTSAYVNHSDLYVHILLNDATGQSRPPATEAEISAAMDQAVSDYTAAVNYANTPEQRLSSELDLAFITADWRGVSRKIEQVIATPGCNNSNWLSTIALSFGYAEGFQQKVTRNRLCDPLRSQLWFTESRAALWAGKPEAALEIARQGDKVAPGAWLDMAMIRALLALKNFEQAEIEIDKRSITSGRNLIRQVMLAAAQGDSTLANDYFEQYLQDPISNDFWALLVYAWMGNVDNANLIAAKMDGHAYGSNALATMISWCACGAPWDLDATPAFAQKLKVSGLPWPPSSPVKFPLKDW